MDFINLDLTIRTGTNKHWERDRDLIIGIKNDQDRDKLSGTKHTRNLD